MTTQEIKNKSVLYKRENNCEMYVQVGKWNQAAKRPDYHWHMISEKTGSHCITTNSNRPDERVMEHWKGFIVNQSK